MAQRGEYNLLSELNIDGECYISQDEMHHIAHDRWTVYATDISCNRKLFKVEAPQFSNEYKITRVGRTDALWTYVVLQYGEYSLVYGHTETFYKVGDVVTKGTVIGKINKTGITTGPHVHIEKRKWNENITFDHKLANDKSILIMQQRWWIPTPEWITRIAMQIIKKYECWWSPHLDAYWDYAGRTIWCGTRSYKGERITANEAEHRLYVIVNSLSKTALSDFRELNVNQYAAIVSLWFNCQKWYNYIRDNWITEEHFKGCNKVNGEVFRWLQKRRDEEWKLFNS